MSHSVRSRPFGAKIWRLVTAGRRVGDGEHRRTVSNVALCEWLLLACFWDRQELGTRWYHAPFVASSSGASRHNEGIVIAWTQYPGGTSDDARFAQEAPLGKDRISATLGLDAHPASSSSAPPQLHRTASHSTDRLTAPSIVARSTGRPSLFHDSARSYQPRYCTAHPTPAATSLFSCGGRRSRVFSSDRRQYVHWRLNMQPGFLRGPSLSIIKGCSRGRCGGIVEGRRIIAEGGRGELG